MSKSISIPYDFTPRTYQVELYKAFDSGVKRGILTWSRRLGKDLSSWQLMIKGALMRKGTFFYILPELNQGRKILWDGIDGGGRTFMSYIPDELIVSKNKTHMQIELFNGSIIQIMGASDPDKFRGTNPIGLIFSEYAFQNPIVWDILRPVLAENGGWAYFNSTPNGRNHHYQMLENAKENESWFYSIQTVETARDEDDKRYISEQVVQEEIDAGMSPDMVQQEFYCSFISNSDGFFYLKALTELEEANRLCEIPYHPDTPVQTFWDLGVADQTAIWFAQNINGAIKIIDFYQGTGKTLGEYATVIQQRGYIYSEHFLPHDSKKREMSTLKSRVDILKELLPNQDITVIPKTSIADGIQAVRAILPRCYFDKDKCKQGYLALQAYHRRYSRAKKMYEDTPVHDWSSDAADAFRYLAMAIVEPRAKKGILERKLRKLDKLKNSASWRTV